VIISFFFIHKIQILQRRRKGAPLARAIGPAGIGVGRTAFRAVQRPVGVGVHAEGKGHGRPVGRGVGQVNEEREIKAEKNERKN
jgi:hypothetical protein